MQKTSDSNPERDKENLQIFSYSGSEVHLTFGLYSEYMKNLRQWRKTFSDSVTTHKLYSASVLIRGKVILLFSFLLDS